MDTLTLNPVKKFKKLKLKKAKRLDWFRKHLTSTEINKNYIPTGYPGLDRKITGLGRGNITIIGARPQNGKTTLDINIVYNLPAESHLIFPTENTNAYWFEKLLSRASGIECKDIKLTSREIMGQLEPYIAELEQRQITLYQKYNPTPDDIRREVERVMPSVLHIDYFQNLKVHRGDAWEYAKILEDLHKIAMDYNIAVVLGSQCKRLDSGENSRAPRIDDLKQTGKQEEAAKIILMIHQDKGQLVVNVAKNNDGEKGEVIFRPDWATNKLEETI